MIIDEIKDNDIAAVSDVMISAYKEEPWNERWTKERAMTRIKAILCNYQAMGLKAVDENEIIGAVMGFVDPYSNEDFFYISELFVRSDRKRQGIGTALMGALEKRLRTNHIQALQLMSIQNNIFFYRQNGLEKDMVDVMYKRLDGREIS